MTAHRFLQMGLKGPESELEDHLKRAVETEFRLLRMVLMGLKVEGRLVLAAAIGRHSLSVDLWYLERPLHLVLWEGWQADWHQVGSI